MNPISNIHYTDAYYISEPVDSLVTKQSHHEALRFVKKGVDESIVISFIKICKDGDARDFDHTVYGLVIPESAFYRFSFF
ncbi:MAG: hypothetical protein WDZ75_01560 [Candidatus Paceibacterota bacterium]